MTIGVIRTAWSGTSGGPGVTQLYMKELDSTFATAATVAAAAAAVRAFFDAMKAYLPNEVTLTTSPVMDFYDEVTGTLTGSLTGSSAPASVTGTSAAVYSMATGMKINLNTAVIRFGRRVRGSIFLVPAASTAMADNGMAISGARTAANTAGATMLGALVTASFDLGVFSRPIVAPNARDGAFSAVTLIETNEKLAILRGRRD